ncbi:CDP-alcohol phosphatidyltransferase family protein [Jiella endophytica]|uniref:CDP-alcohol phosphatidyltransferase family protein n=1 Tax=Jiella endophytica TaxID=2558362 RepID=A0A4Y8RT12_9HYPH|nr:CDP-alcohol phosphatidyltransferase family protein [Jiella endophytica]TFF20777.1 CDP-alcohol phosphatidyltransferase family protein [Jiella endophytica]TFF27078.1 CDP-alcohol phosphatidyltransferase family protein [Jiella endophytica]
MLDAILRRRIDPPVERLAARLVSYGLGANAVTVAGLAIGIGAAAAIALGSPLAGLVLILVSRLCDGLDGAIAKQTRPTDLGGYLDITFDFVFYGAIPLGFAALDPAENALPAAVLLLTFYANGASFLAYAVLAEKRQITTDVRGKKSFFFSTGLAEASETIIAFCLFCLFPAWFPVIAYVFAAMTAWTFVTRVWLAVKTFG